MNRTTMYAVVGAVVALALFGGGYTLGANGARAATPAATSGAATAGGQGAGGAARLTGGGAGGGGANLPINGRVISVNAESITIAVTGRNPEPSASPTLSSSIALVGSGTRVIRTSETDVRIADLKAGDQVTVVGSTDQTTGTITATAIVVGGTNILGQLFGGGGAGGPGAAPRPSASPGR